MGFLLQRRARGPFLPEPVEVIITIPMSDSLRLIGRGLNTGMSYDPVLSPIQLTERANCTKVTLLFRTKFVRFVPSRFSCFKDDAGGPNTIR